MAIEAIPTQLVDAASRPVLRQEEKVEQKKQVIVDEAKKAEDSGNKSVSHDDIKASVERLKQVVEIASGKELNFDVFEENKQMFVKITDKDNKEVVKQIPSEEILKLQSKISDIVGFLLDEKA